jgi:hypothetical protein
VQIAACRGPAISIEAGILRKRLEQGEEHGVARSVQNLSAELRKPELEGLVPADGVECLVFIALGMFRWKAARGRDK